MTNDEDAIKLAPNASVVPFAAVKDADELWAFFLSSKAELTARNYTRDLEMFAEWAECDTPTQAIKKLLASSAPAAHKTILAYVAALQSWPRWSPDKDPDKDPPCYRGYAASTVNRRVSAIRSVLSLGRVCGMISWSLELRLPSAGPENPTKGPGPDGYEATLAAMCSEAQSEDQDKRFRALRDIVLIRLMHDSALRVSEALGIHWPSQVELDPERSDVMILGKGRRAPQWVPISKACAESIEAYLEVRGRDKGPLFYSNLRMARSRAAKVMDRSTVNRRLLKWKKVVGVHLNPHGFRHTAITTALDMTNGDDREVQRLSRHRSRQSLESYDGRRGRTRRRLTEALSDPSKADSHRDLDE